VRNSSSSVYRGWASCVGDSTWPLFGWLMFKRTDKVDWTKMQYWSLLWWYRELRP
jgi:hypothetical protein